MTKLEEQWEGKETKKRKRVVVSLQEEHVLEGQI